MKATTRRTAVAVAVAVLGVVGIAVAAPAVAGANPFGRPTITAPDPSPGYRGGPGTGPHGGPGMGPGTGMEPGTGPGMGSGMGAAMGSGMGGAHDGQCLDPAVTAEKGTLTAGQQATLAAMAQEEKLAHELYVAFAARYDAVVFDHIAAAETRHLTAVRTLLDRYGLTDPTAGKPAGQFSDPAVQATYDRLLAQGQAGQTAALQVGQQVEQTDINDLRAALNGLTAPDVRQVYTQLLAASEHHLSAFQRWSTR